MCVCDVTSIRGCKKYEDIDTGKQDVGGTLMLSACKGIPRELGFFFFASQTSIIQCVPRALTT